MNDFLFSSLKHVLNEDWIEAVLDQAILKGHFQHLKQGNQVGSFCDQGKGLKHENNKRWWELEDPCLLSTKVLMEMKQHYTIWPWYWCCNFRNFWNFWSYNRNVIVILYMKSIWPRILSFEGSVFKWQNRIGLTLLCRVWVHLLIFWHPKLTATFSSPYTPDKYIHTLEIYTSTQTHTHTLMNETHRSTGTHVYTNIHRHTQKHTCTT